MEETKRRISDIWTYSWEFKNHDVAQIEISWPVWYRPIEIDEVLKYLTKQQQSLVTHYHFND